MSPSLIHPTQPSRLMGGCPVRPRLTRWTIGSAALVGLATACTMAPTAPPPAPAPAPAPAPRRGPSLDLDARVGSEDPPLDADAAATSVQRRRQTRSGYTVTVD